MDLEDAPYGAVKPDLRNATSSKPGVWVRQLRRSQREVFQNVGPRATQVRNIGDGARRGGVGSGDGNWRLSGAGLLGEPVSSVTTYSASKGEDPV
ncbi:hypothetical protein NDU88_000394 [Pleurodeles waltl]|uniref:Uncharacterized protein n=1 Tax=Pleurodeles waltl TaxID=8319 RepID=A0AAV7S9E4_PLEWA|nr:hypothetical protein NDU88_000394 [Pleurodeles waltl]